MINWFARHQTAANLLMMGIMLLGLVALPGLQRETFPEIQNEFVQIKVAYPGATADEVEDAVCRRIEDALESVSDMDEIRCEARESIGIATAVMREAGVMTRFLDDVKSEIDTIDDFPDQAEKPIVEELGRTDAVISVAITGPRDPVALKAYTEDLKDRMTAVIDVAEVRVSGFSDHHIRIEVPAWLMRTYGLSAADISTAVNRQSVSSPVGNLEGGGEDLLLRFDDQRKSVEAFEDLVVISGATGAAISLGEIATITDRFDRDEDKVLFNGRRAAQLDITKTQRQDVIEVYQSVRDFITAEQARAPQGIELQLTQDVASVVVDRLDMLVRNGTQGLVLVFLVLWLFFSIRYSFWVTMGLPVSFLGALFLLPILGITINMISMVGLLIGIGLLMDDAIVIAENIASRMEQGDSPATAAIEGVKQVLPGIMSSFATTLLVFGSLAFITGTIGQVLRILPIVLIVVISVSLIEAFWVLPHHLSHSLSHMKKKTTSRFRQRFEYYFNRLRDVAFAPVLEKAIEFRYLTLGIVFMLIIMAVAIPAGGVLKFVGFPDIEGDVLEARLLLPQGTPLSRTEAVVVKMEQALNRVKAKYDPLQPDGQPLVQNVSVIFGQNPDAYEDGPHLARIVVDLLSAEVRNAALDDFRNDWRREVGSLADVIAIKFSEPVVGPGGRAIDVRLLGYDLQRLKSASNELQGWLNNYLGVVDISDDLRPGKREFRLSIKPTAGVIGLDAKAVAEQVRGAFQGLTVDEFPVGAETYEVNLRVAGSDRISPEDLENFTVIGRNGALVPLLAVANLEEARGWARINRIDGRRAVTIQGDVDRNLVNAQELLALAEKEFVPGLLERYPDIRFDLRGESKESAETSGSIVRNMLLGMFGVYMLLALQFRGYIAPLTVMIVIPTALIGVVIGHLVMGLDLTMPSIIGMASLFGVVVNDSILLVVFIRQERATGMPIVEAALQAGIARFRPILLTSITTVAGLLPLLLEKSLQAQILIPLATSLAFGLATATIAALFLVPTVYVILDDLSLLGAIEEEHEEAEPSLASQKT